MPVARLRLHALLALVAAVTLLVAPLGRLATAGVTWGTVTCCCGEHAGDHDCGCPDCPAGKRLHGDREGDRDAAPDDGQAHLRPCSGEAHWASPTVLAPYVAPAPIAIHHPVRRAVLLDEPTVAPPVRVVVPVTPPS